MTAAEAERVLEARAAELRRRARRFTAAGEEFWSVRSSLGRPGELGRAIDEAMGEGQGFVLFRGFERLALRSSGRGDPAVA